MIQIEIVYIDEAGVISQICWASTKDVQKTLTVADVLYLSGFLNSIQELKPFSADIQALEGKVGIFGQRVSLEQTLKTGDRIEIYRPLKQDPKITRRKKAQASSLRSKRRKN